MPGMGMIDEKIQEAVEYNERQGYTETEIRMVQRTVGTKPDAIWGPKTVQAVYDWQGLRGLIQDGKVGPKTWDEVKEEYEDDEYRPPHQGCKPVHGIWIDDHRRIKDETVWDDMLEHGITSIALMVEGHSEKWDPKYDTADMELLCGYAQERGMVVGITDWPYPNREWIDTMFEYLKPWFEAGMPIAFTESDLESNWIDRHVQGFKDLDEAGDYLVDRKLELASMNGARFETTTFTSHTENGRGADVAPHADRIFGQAYSVRNRAKKNPETGKYDVPWAIPYSHTYGPIGMQKHTLDRSLQVPGVEDGRPELGCGLAAYDQKWPGKSPEQAMRAAYDTALLYNPPEIRWWSFKWVFGYRATDYGRRFLKSIK